MRVVKKKFAFIKGRKEWVSRKQGLARSFYTAVFVVQTAKVVGFLLATGKCT